MGGGGRSNKEEGIMKEEEGDVEIGGAGGGWMMRQRGWGRSGGFRGVGAMEGEVEDDDTGVPHGQSQ